MSFGRPRRRRRWPLPLLSVLVAVAIGVPALGGATDGDAGGGDDGAPPGRAAEEPARLASAPVRPAEIGLATSDAGDDVLPADATPVFATYGPVELRVPGRDPLVVGFHEAATVSALGLSPVGRVVANRNATRLRPPEDDPAGTDYLVLSSRGRSAAATSAADIVLRDDEPVLSPVTGTVTDVRGYALYGRHADHRVEIVPDAAPSVRVVVIHVDGVSVEVGDRVLAGTTPLAATANRFPFASHIDRETEPDRWPHVHLEVQPVDAVRPGDELTELEDRDGADAADAGEDAADGRDG